MVSGPLTPSRKTIGLLMDWAESTYQVKIWSGVEDAAKEKDYNLICYVSGSLASPQNPEKQHDRFFKLINRDNIDGLIILTATFTHFNVGNTIVDFINQFRPLPMVSIATTIPGIPSIVIDNAQGMKEMLFHLIDIHQYKRIAFIAGPEGHSDAHERLDAYKEVIKARALPDDPSLIVKGDFSMLSGQAAIYELIDKRKTAFDAIVSTNDQMAIGALAALSERGYNIPADTAITGFDDIGMYKTVVPPLTTVRQPLFRQGKRAFEILLELIDGKQVIEEEIIPTTLILRESCGCFSQSAKNLFIKNFTSTLSKNEKKNRDQLQTVFLEIMTSLKPLFFRLNPLHSQITAERIEQLYNAFVTELMFEESGSFLYLWNETLTESLKTDHDVSGWQAVLSAFHRYIKLLVFTNFAEQKAELIIKQARRLIMDMEKRVKEYRQIESTHELLAAQQLGEELIVTSDIGELVKLLADVLPKFGIKCCYLSLYRESEARKRYSQLILAFNEEGIMQITRDKEQFSDNKLIPEGLLPSNRRFSLMVDTLYHMDEQLGFGVLEIGPQEGLAYDVLRRRLRNAIKGALLLQQVEDQTVALASTNKKLQEEMRIRKQIEKEILEVSGREQKRIGQDLHDDLGQKLTGIAFMCRVLEEKLQKIGLHEALDAAEITKLIDESIEQTKRLARGLIPVELEERGLIHALSELAVKIENQWGVPCLFRCTDDALITDNSVALHLFRIAQEAVHNAVKHASPRTISLELSIKDGLLHLTVMDDGTGIIRDNKRKHGIGLHIMNYRANIIDGTLDIRNNNGGGTIVECTIPYNPPEKKPDCPRKKQKA